MGNKVSAIKILDDYGKLMESLGIEGPVFYASRDFSNILMEELRSRNFVDCDNTIATGDIIKRRCFGKYKNVFIGEV